MSNLIFFPKAQAVSGLPQERYHQISLQISDGSEFRGEVVLRSGQSVQGLLNDPRGFITVKRSNGEIHIVSTELVDGIRVLTATEDDFREA